jgi:hypothetical protein
MTVFLSLLGITMMVAGLAAALSGTLVINIERGWTMVIAGSVVASAGALLIGVAAAVRGLKRVERELNRIRGEASPAPHPAPPPVAAPAPAPASGPQPAPHRPAPPAQVAAPDSSAPPPAARPNAGESPQPPVATAQNPDAIVGSYRAGGCSYVMYADGSIRAETPSGEHRFGSMDEFKAFMLTSAVRSRPPEPPKAEAQPDATAGDQASASPTALSAKA